MKVFRKYLVIGVIFLFVGANFLPSVSSISDNKAINSTKTMFSDWSYIPDIIVPDDYPTIQSAVDNANGGDCIAVRNGTWNENIIINKNDLILCGDLDAPAIINNVGDSNTITINAQIITIADFSIFCNAAAFPDYACVYINGNLCSILRNNICASENSSGIITIDAANTNISKNKISATISSNSSFNEYGIHLDFCKDYIITENRIAKFGTGIDLTNSQFYNVTRGIFCNKITNNNIGIYCGSSNGYVLKNEISNNYVGVQLFGGRADFDTNNIINNNHTLELISCIAFFIDNNLYNDSSTILVAMNGGIFVIAPFNYWGTMGGSPYLHPRRRVFPIYAPILMFPWRLKPVDIPQCWPD